METAQNTKLLSFLTAEDRVARVLVIEALHYLPELRRRYPEAALFAVTAQPERAEAETWRGLSVAWKSLDYRETPLPYAPKSFDVLIVEKCVEETGNPQDMLSGLGSFIKDTGCLLTSFSNIRHWRILEQLMDGHYYAIVRRLYARPEFERLLYASFYKDAFFIPERRYGNDALVKRLEAAGFSDRAGDLETETWLVQAMRSTRPVAFLKSHYTAEGRKRLATLLRRLAYDIEPEATIEALSALCRAEGFAPSYLARFAKEAIVDPASLFEALAKTGDTLWREAEKEWRMLEGSLSSLA